MGRKLLSAAIWLMYGISLFIAFILVTLTFVVTAPFDRSRRVCNAVFMFFGMSFTYFNPWWQVLFRGFEHYGAEGGHIYLANHQSFLDMPLLARLPQKMKWVSKKELFRIPGAGWMLSMAGHISVDRGSPEARKSIYKIATSVKAGDPVMVFPEGTRSRDGSIKPFKKGAFIVAREHGIPVQPIVVSGTNRLMPPGKWSVKLKGRIYVSLLEKISPDDFGSVTEFVEYTHRRFVEEITKLETGVEKAAS